MNLKEIILPSIISTLLVAELAMLTSHQNAYGNHQSPLILLGAGLLAGVLFTIGSRFYSLDSIEADQPSNWTGFLIAVFIIAIFAFEFSHVLTPEFDKYPFRTTQDVRGSDIIPQIKVMVNRWLEGSFPYQWIDYPEWGLHYALFPTYLPLTWMPFAIPEKLGLDYRVFAIGSLLVTLAWLSLRFRRLSTLDSMILAFSGCMAIEMFFAQRPEIFSLSVESMIAAFYLFFAISLLTRSPYLMGIGLTLCLLSRYSIVLWVPLFFLVSILEDKRKAFIIFGIPAIAFLLLYFFPFLIEDFSIFKQGYDYHTAAAHSLWHPRDWQAPTDTPDNLLKGLGLGIFFYEGVDGEIATKVDAYRRAHFLVSMAVVVILSGVYVLGRKRLNTRFFLLGSLKIYLVVFFNFIQIPFHYLYLTVVAISLAMFGSLLAVTQDTKSNITTKE